MVQHDIDIVAVEVKSEENLQSKSLKAFHCENPEVRCLRTSMADYRQEDWMVNVPLYAIKPKLVISAMMITTLVFEQMSLRFEGAMGFHCNRKTERQMTKRTISLSQMSRAKLA